MERQLPLLAKVLFRSPPVITLVIPDLIYLTAFPPFDPLLPLHHSVKCPKQNRLLHNITQYAFSIRFLHSAISTITTCFSKWHRQSYINNPKGYYLHPTICYYVTISFSVINYSVIKERWLITHRVRLLHFPYTPQKPNIFTLVTPTFLFRASYGAYSLCSCQRTSYNTT